MVEIYLDKIEIGKTIKVTCSNKFRYEGNYMGYDTLFLCLYDFILKKNVYLSIGNITEIIPSEVKENDTPTTKKR